MKLREYNALAHNFAASFASGIGLLVGHCENRVFEEARSRPGGVIEIDFLTGRCPPECTVQLRHAVHQYTEALADFCVQHGAEVSELMEFRVRFYAASEPICGFMIGLTLADGRSSLIDYEGREGKRKRVLDSKGRLTRQGMRLAQARQSEPPSD